MIQSAASRHFQEPQDDGASERPDWREEDAYAYLLGSEPAVFAWEWLRRTEAYRRDFDAAHRIGPAGGPRDPRAWGLCAFAEPGSAFRSARPTWHRRAFPLVLPLSVSTGPASSAIDLRPLLGRRLSVTISNGIEHCLFTGCAASLRFDLHRGSLAAGPFVPRFLLEGAGAAALLPTLAQFLHMAETGDLRPVPSPLHWSRRRMLELRTADALAAGVSQREIAAVLIDADALGPDWRIGLSSVRSRAQRLVRAARWMEGAGWASLLDRRRPNAPAHCGCTPSTDGGTGGEQPFNGNAAPGEPRLASW